MSEQLGQAQLVGSPASTDASFRRYFRYRVGERTWVAMDAPPQQEDSRPFIRVAGLLRGVVNVPDVLAQNLEQGFLLLTDLGEQTYLQALQADPESRWHYFDDAIDALVRLQGVPCPEDLPVYGRALLQRELDLFPEWYVQRQLGQSWSQEMVNSWQILCAQLVERAVAQPQVLVHRDYMPRNLMVHVDNPGVLDFQDAVRGPISYDPVCLFQDAFVSWPECEVTEGLLSYWQRARAARLPVPELDTFLLDCDLMAVQRHLKVIGIFSRICHRDGKPHYLQDVPRFFEYLRGAVVRRSVLLQPLARLLEGLGEAP